jgi:hypothetical protein
MSKYTQEDKKVKGTTVVKQKSNKGVKETVFTPKSKDELVVAPKMPAFVLDNEDVEDVTQKKEKTYNKSNKLTDPENNGQNSNHQKSLKASGNHKKTYGNQAENMNDKQNIEENMIEVEEFWFNELNVKLKLNMHLNYIALITNVISFNQETLPLVEKEDFSKVLKMVSNQKQNNRVTLKVKMALKAVYKKYQTDLDKTTVMSRPKNIQIDTLIMKLETSRKDWLLMLPLISNSQTSDKIFLLLKKMKTVLKSMDVDIDKN